MTQSTPICYMREMDEGHWGDGEVLLAVGETRRTTGTEDVGDENMWGHENMHGP